MYRDEVAKYYDRLVLRGDDPVHDPEVLKSYMDKWDGQRFTDSMALNGTEDVLEIGVGTGRLAVRIAPRCRSFTGIDLSPEAIGRARENLATYPNVKLICGDFCTFETSARYDVIFSSLTFMHIWDKREAIFRVAALLAGGGRFVLSADKNRSGVINYGDISITVYPDDPDELAGYITEAGMTVPERCETEFAHILVAEKQV